MAPLARLTRTSLRSMNTWRSEKRGSACPSIRRMLERSKEGAQLVHERRDDLAALAFGEVLIPGPEAAEAERIVEVGGQLAAEGRVCQQQRQRCQCLPLGVGQRQEAGVRMSSERAPRLSP